MSQLSQNRLVLERLKRSALTPLEALRELGVLRLAARIYDLRNLGHNIEGHWVCVNKADGSRALVMRYYLTRLAGEPPPVDVDPSFKAKRRRVA